MTKARLLRHKSLYVSRSKTNNTTVMIKASHEAAIPNPALDSLKALIGEWDAVGTHPLVPGTKLHGHASFKWIEGGAFLMWQSKVHDDRFPAGLAIFGSDDATGEYSML